MRNLIALCILLAMVSSCKDDEKEVYSQSVKDHSLAEVISMDVFEQVLTIAPTYIIQGEYLADTLIEISANPVLSDPTYPKVITINYGDGVTGDDGKTRQGKIILSINSGTVLSEDLDIDFDDYICNGNTVYGAVNYTYSNSNGIVSYDAEVEGDPLIFVSANGTMKWSSEFTLTRKSGESTPAIGDDEFTFAGNAAGIDLSGRTYTVASTNHTIDFGCNHFIVSGTSTITPNDKDQHTVDYGSGNCDSNGSIQLSDDVTENFTF
jgi:hypothetical protein